MSKDEAQEPAYLAAMEDLYEIASEMEEEISAEELKCLVQMNPELEEFEDWEREED